MKHEITTERVLKAAEGCKDAEKVLKTLFPEAFEDQKVFCHINDILIRKGKNECFYQIKITEGRLCILNLRYDTEWNRRIVLPYDINDLAFVDRVISRTIFKQLIKTVDKIENFKVLKRRDLDGLF